MNRRLHNLVYFLLTMQSLCERLRRLVPRRSLQPGLEEGRRVGVLPAATAAGGDRVGPAIVRGGGGRGGGAVVGQIGLVGRLAALAACPGGGGCRGGCDLVALVGERVLLHVALR